MLSKSFLSDYFKQFDELFQNEILNSQPTNRVFHNQSRVINKSSPTSEMTNNRQDTQEIPVEQLWKTRYVALLNQIKSPDRANKQELDESSLNESQMQNRIIGYLAILEEFMKQLESTVQRKLALQVEVEIGMNVINQAEAFCFALPSPRDNQSDVLRLTVSVILVGVVLERLVKALCQGDSLTLAITQPCKKFELLNSLVNRLEDKGVLNSMIAQQICFWFTLREKALLHQLELINPIDVQNMIAGTRELLETFVKLSWAKG